MKFMTNAIILAAFTLVAADSPEPAPNGNVIKGIWATVSITTGGVKQPEDPTAGAALTAFDGTNFVQRQGLDVVQEGTYTVNPDKSPATIDMKITSGHEAGKTQLGIYQLDGQTLKLFVAPPGAAKRPKSFSSSDSQNVFVVTRRFKP